MRGSKMDEVTKILHLHTRIGYMRYKKWADTTDMAPPGNYQIKTLVTDPRYIYSEPWKRKQEGASIFNTVFGIHGE